MQQTQYYPTEQTYLAEPGITGRRFLTFLLWVNFAMLVLNAGLAVTFWLSKSGPTLPSLLVAFFSCAVIVFFKHYSRRRATVTLTGDAISYRSPMGVALGPILWSEIEEVRLERSLGRAWLWLQLRSNGKRVSVAVPWIEADLLLARCQEEINRTRSYFV